VVPVLKDGDKWVRNPMIITDRYVEDGEIVYGEYVKDKAQPWAKAKANFLKELTKDFELLDKEVNKIIWTFANLFPGCVIKSIDGIRMPRRNSSGTRPSCPTATG
jgi:6-oxo-cyclohex-1-ene-carbonyl-CoA hydrolase